MLVTYLRPLNDSLLVATIEGGSAPGALVPVAVESVSASAQAGLLTTTVRVRPTPGATQFFVRVRYSYP